MLDFIFTNVAVLNEILNKKKKIAQIKLKFHVLGQVEDFWAYYNHLIRPNDLQYSCDYHLFRSSIRPMWEVSLSLLHWSYMRTELRVRTKRTNEEASLYYECQRRSD